MSKASKSRSKDRRKKVKAVRKTAQQAKYEGFKNTGQNSKSKRFVLRNKRAKKSSGINHPTGPCGNTACVQCFAVPSYGAFRVNGRLVPGHPHKAWLVQQRKVAQQLVKVA